MSAWQPLRTWLEDHLDGQIAAEPDRELRALLAYHRERIVDQAELILLRRMVAPEDEDAPPRAVRINGHRAANVQ